MKALSDTLVVATKDRPTEVAALLALLASMTELPTRILVLDASDDDLTAQVCSAAALPDVVAGRLDHVKAHKAGLASQRNQALQLVRTDLVHFLDDDSRPEPDYFAQLVAFFASDTTGAVGAVTGLVTNPGPARRSSLLHRILLLDPPQGRLNRAGRNAVIRPGLAEPLEVICLSGCTMTFRRDLVLALGFDESLEAGPTGGYALGEDLEIGLRAAAISRVYCVPSARLRHEESVVNRAKLLTYERASAAFRRRLAEDPAVDVSMALFRWSCLGEAALAVLGQLLGREAAGVSRARAILQGAGDRSVVRRRDPGPDLNYGGRMKTTPEQKRSQ